MDARGGSGGFGCRGGGDVGVLDRGKVVNGGMVYCGFWSLEML